MKAYRNPANVHAPMAAYTHQIEVQEPARWLVMSGQLGKMEDGTVAEDPMRQLAVAFDNIARNLHAAQMEMGDLVKLTIYLVGDFDVQQRRAVISTHLKEPWPCVTLLMVAALADPVYKVEIDAWAAQGGMAATPPSMTASDRAPL
ncbi:MAG TPA: RidA family protein [Abditibacteriaceae bacterium]|nr:RidA family protein [Abditibacteriaceae bacterium]